MKKSSCNTQSGNVFFMIMIGIVLFAALMFTFARGMRQGGNDMSDRQADIAVSDMLGYAQKIERGVDRLIRRSVSETDLSFDNRLTSGSNANCTSGNCKIFDPAGGSLTWQSPPPNVNDGSDWIFNANNFVNGVGCSTAGDTACTDLTLFLRNIRLNACLKINEKLGNENPGGAPPEDASNVVDETALFAGSFAQNESLSVTGGHLDGKSAGCFEEASGTYFFYYVLLAR